METNNKRNVTVKKLPGSEVEIESELSAEEIAHHRPHAIKHLNEETKLPGFRPGHIPESVLVERIGEIGILEETARHVLAEVYPEILTEHSIDAIGRPEIVFTKMTKNQPVSFRIKTSVVPEVKLPDYKAIAKKEMAKPLSEPTATEKEIEEAIKNIRRHAILSRLSPEESKSMTKEKMEAELAKPLTDELVKQWGDFKDIPDFQTKLKEALLQEKTREAKEKRRIAIVDAILEPASVDIPRVLVEHETKVLEARLEEDLQSMGTTIEEYAKNIKKTPEEIRENMKPSAEKKAKLQLVLNEIAKLEKIKVDGKEVEEEAGHLLKHYPDADPGNVRLYAATIIANEKVFALLESQK